MLTPDVVVRNYEIRNSKSLDTVGVVRDVETSQFHQLSAVGRRLSLLPWSNDAWDMKSYGWNRLGPLEGDLLWGPLDSTPG
jgi:hypothetical protein